MESLATTLQRLGVSVEALGTSTERLVKLESTDDIRARLEQAQQRLDQVSPDAPGLHHRLEGEVVAYRRLLAQAEQRDALAAKRPEGCWCLGLGGRNRVGLGWIRPPLKNSKREIIDPGEIAKGWAEYCDCPEGQAARAEAKRLTREINARSEQAQVDRLWEALPDGYRGFTLESFLDLGPAPEQRGLVPKLQQWLDTDRWLLLWGETGLGKSGLSAALLSRMMTTGKSGLMVVVPEFLWRVRSTFGPRSDDRKRETEDQIMGSLTRVDVLVLDDLGKEHTSDWVAETLYRVIDYRYTHLLRTIITSNLSPDEIAERLGDWTFWRISQRAHPYLLKVEGENLRKPLRSVSA